MGFSGSRFEMLPLSTFLCSHGNGERIVTQHADVTFCPHSLLPFVNISGEHVHGLSTTYPRGRENRIFARNPVNV